MEVGGNLRFDIANSLPFRHFEEKTRGFGVIKDDEHAKYREKEAKSRILRVTKTCF